MYGIEVTQALNATKVGLTMEQIEANGRRNRNLTVNELGQIVLHSETESAGTTVANSQDEVIRDDDQISEGTLLGYLTAAYVLDVAGLLQPQKKAKLDSLVYPGCARWDVAVEGRFAISRTFIQSVYSLYTRLNSSSAAVAFILRGLGCPDYEARLSEVLR